MNPAKRKKIYRKQLKKDVPVAAVVAAVETVAEVVAEVAVETPVVEEAVVVSTEPVAESKVLKKSKKAVEPAPE